MDLQKIATYGTAAAVVGTGAVVGGGQIIDQQMGGPAKRQEVQLQEIRKVVREEVRSALEEAWPTQSGPVKGLKLVTPDANK
ncbi:hypothetical protein CYVG_00092 [Cyanophage S-SSM6a]|jgi:hypothetical protein|uniref:Uncharacterized protein n=1 Tax=Synechococcus phage S-SSM7 TaxID=445686 RepID=E3SLE1_9CAUD|nr:hypothetical protein SSSM7_224 [Synechococcus phage S-SSM7]ADO98289.1 hypothetical protein SSSM7_224 [Synechococcus phage S-SSM7]AGH07536.1 hypothetical protein CYVG_00092 [Cyanophage S-SSM6a]|tara:strand:+ start:642 stop:887 length:246 start_codon:yes stop_codon:yes gene_type:complete